MLYSITRGGITACFIPCIREAPANLTALLPLFYRDPLAFPGVLGKVEKEESNSAFYDI